MESITAGRLKKSSRKTTIVLKFLVMKGADPVGIAAANLTLDRPNRPVKRKVRGPHPDGAPTQT